MIERPRLRADQVVPGDRLLVCEALDPTQPGPAMPLVMDAIRDSQGVTLVLDRWEDVVVVPSHTPCVVERAVG